LADCCLLPNYVVPRDRELLNRNREIVQATVQVPAAVATTTRAVTVAKSSDERREERRGKRQCNGEATSTSTQMNFALTPKRLTNKQRSVASNADNL